MINLRRALIAALLVLSASATFAKQALEEIVRKDYPVSPNVALTLHVADGTVHIYGGEQNVVALLAIKKAYTKERLDGIKVDVRNEADAFVIETTFPPKPEGLSIADRSGTVDYVLIVPQTCSLKEIQVENGEVIVEGIRGAGVNVRLTNGRMLVKNCFTDTSLTIGRGGIDVGYFWWEDRAFSLTAQSANADIRVALPPNASARFDAATGDGWIRNQFAPEGQNDDARNLQWTFGADPLARINLRAQSGNLRIEKIY